MKLLKKIIWDFHTKNIFTTEGCAPSLNGNSDICDVICDTLLLMVLCFIVYVVIVGLPVYLISGWILCYFVGMGEILYVDIAMQFLITSVILAVGCAAIFFVYTLLELTYKLLVTIGSKLNVPTFKVKDKVCFKVDFSDMEG